MKPFAEAIDATRKYVVSSTLAQVDWNAELVRGDLGAAVEELKRESGRGLFVGGVTLPRSLTSFRRLLAFTARVSRAWKKQLASLPSVQQACTC